MFWQYALFFLFSSEVWYSKNEWSYTSTPQYAFLAWCLVKAKGKLYLFMVW